MNLPNFLTIARILLSLIYFVVLAYLCDLEVEPGGESGIYQVLGTAAIGLFVLAMITDLLDGYLARSWDQESPFGRFADPLADKILICGSFVMILGLPDGTVEDILKEWMVLIVLLREFLVQGIRTAMEKQNVEFPALAWGKVKMVIQCITVLFLLIYLTLLPDYELLGRGVFVLVILMVISTILSGIVYLYHAGRFIDQGVGGS